MLDINRRNFLKGLAIAAGAATMPALPPIEADAAPPVKVKLPQWEPGELWAMVNNQWHLVGRYTAVSAERTCDYVSYAHARGDSPFRVPVLPRLTPTDIEVQMLTDDTGNDLIMQLYHAGQPTRVFFGCGDYGWHVKDAYIFEVHRQVDQNGYTDTLVMSAGAVQLIEPPAAI